ncbi:MAG: helix-turn-helix domain-containing protein [Deltaproteobacteria bacterium]|nr:helix-turn-helix domain-containing protein [Deltaproteobacteria bacterium]MBW2595837.1 helix-turn-helix domain-containing protein [Deltaproteobacteria bacterium]
MNKREQIRAVIREEIDETSFPLIEEILEKRIDKVVTILGCEGNGRDGVYDEVLSMVEKALIKIAMRRSSNVKTAAADFLGINRNTLHTKMKKLKIR